MFYYYTLVKVQEDKLADIIASAQILAPVARAEEGCIEYKLLQPNDATDAVVFWEIWESAESFATHVALGEIDGTPLNEFGKIIGPATTEEPLHWENHVLV